MKKTILLFFLLIVHVLGSAQQHIINADSIVKLLSGKTGCGMFSQPKEKEYKLSLFSCLKINIDTPFYVVDGIPKEESEVKKINPDDIISIDILKPLHVKLYCNSSTPLIVIVTKNANQRTIIVKDAETGERLPSATVEFSEMQGERTRLIADSAGGVITNKIESGKQYELRVSSIGYKSFTATVNTKVLKTNYTVLLQKDHRELMEVVVSSIVCHTICRRWIRCIKISTRQQIAANQGRIKIYPNPVLRSQKINLEFESQKVEKITVRLFSIDGKLVSSGEYRFDNGINRISYPINSWIPAGVYSFQLTDQDGRLINTEQLIIQ